MATYIIKREKAITRQAGDYPAPIVVVVPESIDMTDYDAQFKVIASSRRTIFSKTTSGGTITKDGQTLTIPLTEADTKGKNGSHTWEMQITKTGEVITIGRGKFTILNEKIR